MTRRLVLTYLAITALVLVMVVVPLGLTFASRERDRLLAGAERDAQAVAARVEEDLEDGARPNLEPILAGYEVDGARVLVVDEQGRSVADSSSAALDRDYSTRPEVERALQGTATNGTRYSKTLGTNLAFVAVPVASGGTVHGAVRITLPSRTVDERVRDTWYRLAALSVVVLLVVGAVGWILARGVTRPVRQIEDAAQRLAAGDLSARVGAVSGPPELLALATQFDATADRLEQLVEAQQRFVGDASHQLRTPLTALRLRLETLHPSPDDEPRVAAALAETDRLGRLVQSLLDLARADGAQAPLVTVDLVAIARERHGAWSEVADRRGVALALHADDDVPARALDGAIEQVLDNLLSNALEVAPAGSTITIEVLRDADDATARLRVVDEGPGMPPEHRAQATGRFWRPPDAPKGGSGLGLSIVDHLATASGGRVLLDEGPDGRGLAVEVRLPLPPQP